ncbi:Aste57867_9002 [Aphanomyces stellatus]|uniref:Aste57867_9002 protein n=1 Tax=Aphanomyces stellatus TaxID=120398 RepID=A0A485KM33_9STRA|nr:hypothetical protein As57867_008967 [Aphanomyces stellatus]VFT85886.1 Aste57867_9002 [Aphanomyces stellatus]
MLSLFCVAIGEGRPFKVEVDKTKFVYDFKVIIKGERPNFFTGDASDLDLYVAIMDNEWMSATESIYEELAKHDGVPGYLIKANRMNPAREVGKCLPSDLGTECIHILVVDSKRAVEPPTKKLCTAELPQVDAKLNPISLENFKFSNLGAWEINKWINTQEISCVTDFPEEYFVRKESVGIFDVLKGRGSYQIVLMGSPGVGKSLLLVLYAFWMAFQEKRSVLLVRRIKGEGKCIFFVYLNGDDPSKCWMVSKLTQGALESLVDKYRTNNCLLCLDGFLQSEMTIFLETFSVLATSAQYNTKQEDGPVLKTCLVPFWSHSDLQLFGEHKNMDSDSIEKMYFISGGSLRLFLMDEKTAMNCIDKAFSGVDYNSADLFKTQYGTSSMSQIDRIRMATLKRDGEYTAFAQRSYFICSGYALMKIGEYVKLDYYKNLWCIAQATNDQGLAGIAFKNMFHTMAREKKPIKLNMRDYDRVRTTNHEYSEIDFTSSSTCLRGENNDDFKDFITHWPGGVDYWYPRSRSLQSIDSIAKIGDKYCCLKLTTAQSHSINPKYLEETLQLTTILSNICYVAVVPNKDTCDAFRLRPTDPKTKIPLFVAYVNDNFLDKPTED